MGRIWSELFPTRLSIVFFTLYILLFVNQGILVTASQTSSSGYEYNIITVVLLTEFLKLFISVCLYSKDHTIYSLVLDVVANRKVLALYCVPAFLYCLYNNLAFFNLSAFDPTTYYLLLQFRVVVTAILFQFIFKKQLTRLQWFSLVLLTVGCMLKQVNFTKDIKVESSTEKYSNKANNFNFSINAVFILLQTICSCLAGVYNEYLLKKPGANVNIYVQNVFMYLDSIFCNAVLLIVQGNLPEALSIANLEKIFHYKVMLIMVNNAAVGIITSFFLKTMNSILKTFASALELILTAILSYILFSIPIHLNTALSIFTVLCAVYLYSQNPVQNVQVRKVRQEEEDEKIGLIMEKV